MKLLACLGLVWIIKDSYILSAPRDYLKSKSKHLTEFLSCSLCLGFWAGVILAFLEFKFSKIFTTNYFFYPFAVAAFCWFFDSLLDLIQECWVFLKKIRENS